MSRRATDPEELERLRAIVADRVRNADLPTLAAIVGQSDLGIRSVSGAWTPAQLKEFLHGFEDRLRHERAFRASPAPEADDPQANELVALGALVRDLPAEGRQCAIVQLLRIIAATHDQYGVALPAWFTQQALVA